RHAWRRYDGRPAFSSVLKSPRATPHKGLLPARPATGSWVRFGSRSVAELRRSSCIVHGTVALDMSRPAARGPRWQAEGPQAGPATSGRRLAPTTPTCSPIAPAVRHVEIGPSVTLVPHGWQLVIRKDAGHGRVGAFMLRHGSQRTPPWTLTVEPREKLASPE